MKRSVGRPRVNPSGKKDKISVTLDPGLLKWVTDRCGPGREFNSVSHALERGISALQKQEK